jgi:hypothetical protein
VANNSDNSITSSLTGVAFDQLSAGLLPDGEGEVQETTIIILTAGKAYYRLYTDLVLLLPPAIWWWRPIVAPAIGGAAGLTAILRERFASFGIPDAITTDGGPEFTAHLIAEFLTNWGVQHRLCSAYPGA